ncbi:TetR/AcrR family transcriptional regulator [Streptomyces sp. NPDC090442]|uniref:TetR/AcrR family transcriptional regulator n=1 Tax=Streptomyces sp. NPDC090442 TaxID=3365962 RepID=UPI003803B380
MARRREQVLDAAVEVLGAQGARRLTYQAVDRAAGVPTGTTSNYFRNRAALVDGIAEHLLVLERREWAALTTGPAPVGPDELIEAMAAFARYAAGPGRSRTAARLALLLESSARPELRASLDRGRQEVLRHSTEWVRLLGSGAPERHGRILVNHLEGVVLRQLTFQDGAFDPTEEMRALVGGLLGGGD